MSGARIEETPADPGAKPEPTTAPAPPREARPVPGPDGRPGTPPEGRRVPPELPAETAGTEQELLVRHALWGIAPKQRAVLVLRYFEDLSVEETAAALGCSTGNVKSQSARGRRTRAGRARRTGPVDHRPHTVDRDASRRAPGTGDTAGRQARSDVRPRRRPEWVPSAARPQSPRQGVPAPPPSEKKAPSATAPRSLPPTTVTSDEGVR